jgi:hypothetical protein
VGAGSVSAAGTGAGITAGEVSAAASLSSSIYTLSQGAGKVNDPPAPNQLGSDATVADAQQQQLRRQQAAGGIDSTTGTSGGQAGAVLNPSSMSTHSLLGG